MIHCEPYCLNARPYLMGDQWNLEKATRRNPLTGIIRGSNAALFHVGKEIVDIIGIMGTLGAGRNRYRIPDYVPSRRVWDEDVL